MVQTVADRIPRFLYSALSCRRQNPPLVLFRTESRAGAALQSLLKWGLAKIKQFLAVIKTYFFTIYLGLGCVFWMRVGSPG